MSHRRQLAVLAALLVFPATLHALPRIRKDTSGGPALAPRPILRKHWFYDPRVSQDTAYLPYARAAAMGVLQSLPYSPLQSSGGGYSPQGGGVYTPPVIRPWNFVGPRPLKQVPQQYGFGDASIRATALAIHPANADIVYAGTIGGVVKSTDGGVNWNYISDNLPSQMVASIVIDTTSPNIVYGGTGDTNYAGRGVALLGVGVYRSTDSGATWGQYGLSELGGMAIVKLALDPTTGGSVANAVLYAAARSDTNQNPVTPGLYKSLNGGQTWTLKTAGLGSESGFDVALDTTNPSTVWFANVSGLYRSTDGGDTWLLARANLLSGVNANGKGQISLSGSTVYFSNGDGKYTATIYGGTAENPVSGQIWRSTDLGASWTELTAARGFCGGQCFFDLVMGVDPSNADRIFAGGVDLSSSSNGGASFTDFGGFNPPNQVLHSDQHSIAFSASSPAVIYEGNDGGVYKSTDSGVSWQNMNANLPGGLVVGVSVSGDATRGITAGFQDNGSNFNYGGSSFTMIRGGTGSTAELDASGGGDGGFNKISASNEDKIYHTYVISNKVEVSYLKRTDDAGVNSAFITPPAAVGVETAQFYPPMSILPQDDAKLFVGFNHVWRTADSGANWTRIGPVGSPASGHTITHIGPAQGNPNYIYTGTTDGSVHRVYVTKSAGLGNGASWTQCTSGLPAGQMATAFAVHPTDPKTAYAVFSQYGSPQTPLKHVYKTTDGCLNWVAVSTGLPDVPFHDVVLDTAAPNNVFAASDVGVFNSIDGGRSWLRMDLGMPTGLIANSLSFHSGTRQLVVGTFGRGVFSVTLPRPPPAPAGLAVATLSTSAVSWTWSASPGQFDVSVYAVYRATSTTALLSSGTATGYAWEGLLPNTTYGIVVTAANGVLESVDSAPISTSTLANPPLTPAASAVSTGTLTAAWAANGNPAGTLYQLQISTDGFATLSGSSRTAALDATVSGLIPNTTYELRVRAINNNEVATAFVTGGSTSTVAAAPTSALPALVSVSSVTAAWGAGGNRTGTFYEAQISLDSFATVQESSVTTGLSATFLGLSSNTLFQFRIRVLPNDGSSPAFTALPSTRTLNAPSSVVVPGDAATPFASVGTASVTVSWTSGGNLAGTFYVADLSTDNFVTLNASSQTFALAASFGTGGEGPALTPNRRYHLRVRASDGPNTSGFQPLGSIYSLAEAPTGAAIGSVFISSATMSWGAAGNPVGTFYLAQASTNGFASVAGSSLTLNTSASLTGLPVNAGLDLRVAALNAVSSATAFASAGSTTTLAGPPSGASASVGVSSAALTWLANGNPAGTLYQAVLSTDGFATINLDSATYNLSVVFGSGGAGAALSPNTTHFLSVQALNLASTPTAELSVAAVTLPMAPAAGVVVSSHAFITLSWAAGGNPAQTLYDAQMSTDAFVTLVLSSATRNLSVQFGTGGAGAALTSNATYHLRVRAFGHSGQYSAFDAPLSTWTIVAAPVSAAPSGVAASALSVNWSAAGNRAGTVYEAQLSTDAFTTLVASSLTANTSASFTALSANTAYASRVRAFGAGGGVTAYAALPSTTTLLLAPTAPASPFTTVDAASATVAWGNGGNGAGTVYVVQLSTDSFATVNVASSTFNLAAIFGTTGEGPALAANTTYFSRVRAENGPALSAWVSLGSTATLAAAPGVPAAASAGTATFVFSWGASGNPSDTRYDVELSTDGFATVSASSRPAGAGASFAGLAANTTYFARVLARNRGGVPTGYAVSAATSTSAAAPLASAPSSVSVSAIRAYWGSNGNAAGSIYLAEISTDSHVTLNASSSTANAYADFGGLTGNTTYQLRVRAQGNASQSGYVSLGSTATLAYAPSATAFASAGVHFSSANLTWTNSGNDATTTVYESQASTDGFATIVVSSKVAANNSLAVVGLAPNTTYFFRLRAIPHGHPATAFDATVTSATRLAALTSAPVTGLGAQQVTANWAAGGNGSTTLYEAQITTDAFTTLVASSLTYNASATFAGLTANTAYDLRVRAKGHAAGFSGYLALGATTTLLLPPGAAGSPFPATASSTIVAQWTSGGNGGGTTYVAQMSTDAFASVNASSSTFGLTALFGPGGAGPALTPNTTYQFRVQAVNGPAASAQVAVGTNVSLATAPISTVFLAVGSTTVTVDWSPNGNPEPGTSYEIERSLSAGFASPVTTVVSTSVHAASGLSASTTYYFRARARSHGGLYSDYDAVVSTLTLPTAPGVPGTPSGTAQGVSSITWTWAAASAATSYKVYYATNTASLIASPGGTTFTQTGLSTNTLSGIVVAGVNASGEGVNSSSATAYTLAQKPASTAGSPIFASSATVTWSLNTNSTSTVADVEKSTDNAVFGRVSSGVFVSYLDRSLLGCTTYYYRVRNFNGAGIATVYDTTLQFVTLASTPTPAGNMVASQQSGHVLRLTWSLSAHEGVTSYRLYYDNGTGTVNYAAPLAVLSSTVTSYTSAALTPDTAYKFGLRASHRCGVEEKNTGVTASATAIDIPPAAVAFIGSPDGGLRLSGDAVSVIAEIDGDESLISEVRFQYKPSTAAVWADLDSIVAERPNPATEPPYLVLWDTSELESGSYDLRAMATDTEGVTHSTPTSVSVEIEHEDFDILESLLADGSVERIQALDMAATNTIQSADNDTGLVTTITIPPGALTSDTQARVITNPPAAPAAPTSAVKVASLQIELLSGQTSLSGGNSATLALAYPDVNGDGVVDETTIRADRLQMFTYDAAAGRWVKLAVSSVDTSARTVTATTTHFSFFALMSPAAADLSALRVYPNPFKPNSGNPDEGRAYSAGDPNSGIVFDNLPTSVTITIYTLTARRVARLSTTAGAGKIQWDARNEDGRDAASGGYFAVIESPGQARVVRRFAVIR